MGMPDVRSTSRYFAERCSIMSEYDRLTIENDRANLEQTRVMQKVVEECSPWLEEIRPYGTETSCMVKIAEDDTLDPKYLPSGVELGFIEPDGRVLVRG